MRMAHIINWSQDAILKKKKSKDFHFHFGFIHFIQKEPMHASRSEDEKGCCCHQTQKKNRHLLLSTTKENRKPNQSALQLHSLYFFPTEDRNKSNRIDQ